MSNRPGRPTLPVRVERCEAVHAPRGRARPQAIRRTETLPWMQRPAPRPCRQQILNPRTTLAGRGCRSGAVEFVDLVRINGRYAVGQGSRGRYLAGGGDRDASAGGCGRNRPSRHGGRRVFGPWTSAGAASPPQAQLRPNRPPAPASPAWLPLPGESARAASRSPFGRAFASAALHAHPGVCRLFFAFSRAVHRVPPWPAPRIVSGDSDMFGHGKRSLSQASAVLMADP